MPLFVHDNGAVHYLERGRGEPLLLIHGLGSSGADWALQVAALERRFRVIAPDLPGCGHSAAPRGERSIAGFAASLWALLDHLEAPRVNIVGFSLGGAVGLEMALQRPESVHRLALINSLATYRLDHWSKWLEAVLPQMIIPLVGMRRAAQFAARRLFPKPWQRPLRERAAQVVSAVPASSYLSAGRALIGWTAIDRLHRLKSKVLMIAAERDFTPLAEKRSLAARLGADFVLVRGSRHGTPFDAVKVTNASLLALLTDQPLPPPEHWTCDEAAHAVELPLTGTIAEEHARQRIYSPASPVAG
jgi:pimeloyl-ACP methyl ester carboxylesterase